MITNIRTTNYKGVKNIKLYGIGKINIVCGKNNSGKSSVLEGLEKNGSLGIHFDDYQIICQKWLQHYTQQGHDFRLLYSKLFEEYFDEYFRENNNIMFLDDIPNLSQAVSKIMTTYPYTKWSVSDSSTISNVLNSFFEDVRNTYTPILMPAKRILEFEESISLSVPFEPNGKGVLNHLFFLKNQDLSSEKFVLYQEIHSIFKEITGYDFNIVPSNGNTIALRFRVNSQWLHADQCGLGLRELLTMVSYIFTTSKSVILLEEPENHLHADFQKKFISFLKKCDDKQFIIATHSNVFIDNSYVDKIFYCWYEDEVKLSDKTSISKIIDSLGYSIAENLVSDAIIFTEGPTDVPLLKRILNLNGVLNNYNIKFWPLGGDIMGSTDLSLFNGLDKVFAIIDTDPGSTKVRNQFIKNCKIADITCYKLERYAIENYIPLKAYRSQYPDLAKTLTELDNNKNIDEQLGFKSKNKSVKEKNFELALKVNIEDLKDTDLLKFMNAIKSFLDKKNRIN